MNAVMGIIQAISIPLIVLNLIGGVASGIWLVIIGDWRTVGLGIGLFFVSTLILSDLQ